MISRAPMTSAERSAAWRERKQLGAVPVHLLLLPADMAVLIHHGLLPAEDAALHDVDRAVGRLLGWAMRQLEPPPVHPAGDPKRERTDHGQREEPLRCGARTRAGHPCKRQPVEGKRRCPNHGGLSTGPRTPEGKAKALACLAASRTARG